MDLRGVIGVNALQLDVQRCATHGVGPGLQAGADSRVDFFRGKVHAVQKAGDIESCAPHNDGQLAACREFPNQRIGGGGEICHAIRHFRL